MRGVASIQVTDAARPKHLLRPFSAIFGPPRAAPRDGNPPHTPQSILQRRRAIILAAHMTIAAALATNTALWIACAPLLRA